MLPLLFLGEGSEVAVAMLIDKDPEQFGHPVRLWFKDCGAAVIRIPHLSSSGDSSL